MNSRSKYKTKKRDLLLDYLASVRGKHTTAGDICEYFRASDAEIGQSTVYRQLESLVDDGLIGKYTIDGNSPACFEYIGRDKAHKKGGCFHCKCAVCGRLIHLGGDEIQPLKELLLTEYGFALDAKRTVLYGLCENCK